MIPPCCKNTRPNHRKIALTEPLRCVFTFVVFSQNRNTIESIEGTYCRAVLEIPKTKWAEVPDDTREISTRFVCLFSSSCAFGFQL